MTQRPLRALVGVDALDRSRGALAVAERLVVVGRADCKPVHIVELVPELFPDWVSSSTRTWSVNVAAAAAKAVAPSLPVLDVLEALPPELGLEHAVRHLDADLLIVGRKARADERALVRLGGVARQLLRSLPCAIAVVPPDYTPPDESIRPILLATNLGVSSRGAATMARQLATSLDAPLMCVHTVDRLPPLPSDVDDETRRRMLLERSSQAENALETWCLEVGLKAGSRHIVTGDPLSALDRMVTDFRPQLVVCGSRLLGTAARLFSTSVGSTLAATLPVPVVVCP